MHEYKIWKCFRYLHPQPMRHSQRLSRPGATVLWVLHKFCVGLREEELRQFRHISIPIRALYILSRNPGTPCGIRRIDTACHQTESHLICLDTACLQTESRLMCLTCERVGDMLQTRNEIRQGNVALCRIRARATRPGVHEYRFGCKSNARAPITLTCHGWIRRK